MYHCIKQNVCIDASLVIDPLVIQSEQSIYLQLMKFSPWINVRICRGKKFYDELKVNFLLHKCAFVISRLTLKLIFKTLLSNMLFRQKWYVRSRIYIIFHQLIYHSSSLFHDLNACLIIENVVIFIQSTKRVSI